jgi:hypothetical protein
MTAGTNFAHPVEADNCKRFKLFERGQQREFVFENKPPF